MNTRAKAAVVVICALGWAGTARAQSSLQVPIQFDFLNPGARSLSLGSAFTAVADDATAALTNPAGLTLLSRPEVSFEGRGRHLISPYLYGGRLSGTATNQGVDTTSSALYRDSVDSGGGVSFLSIVVPRGTWAISAYRHELLRVDQQYQTQGVFQRVVFSGSPSDSRELPQIGQREVNITSYGVAGAYRPNAQVAIGAGVSVYKFSIDALFRRYSTIPFYGAPDYIPAREVARASQAGDDTSLVGNVGVLFTPDSRFRLGASYRRGPRLGFTSSDGASPATTVTFKVPDTFSIGAMFRVIEPFTLGVDYSRVQYSSLRNDFVTSQATGSGRPDNFQIDDGNELHVGAEYVFVRSRFTPAVRVGTWYDPAHAVRYQASAANDAFDERFSAALPGADNLMHLTFGGGLSLSRQVEVNGAADFASQRRLVSGSAVFRF